MNSGSTLTTEDSTPPEVTRRGARVIDYLKGRANEAGALTALVLLWATFAILSPGFRTFDNLITVGRQVSLLAIVGVGVTFVIITAGIDLAVGSMVALSGVVMVKLVTERGVPAVPSVLITIALLGCIGAFVGASVSLGGLQPFVVTLAVFASARGLAAVATGGSVVLLSNPTVLRLGTGYVGNVPIPIIIAVVALATGHIILTRTRYGRYVYAIGGNEEAARVSGVPVRRIKTSVYVLSACMSALAGVVLAGRLHAGDPLAGTGLELDVIAAVVIGGTSLFGGVGNMRGTLIGVLIIGVISNGLTILNVQTFWQDVVKGVVIFLAMSVDAYLRKHSKARLA